MKKILAAFVGIAFIAACQLCYAAAAVVTAVTGTAEAAGTGAVRPLRIGDSVDQGDTIITGSASSVVLRFEDGQIAGLTANSRMVVTTYLFNRTQPAQSNVFFSLLLGSMRAITGLIGKAQPERVAYRAGTATIGIRGTDVLLTVLNGTTMTIRVTEGRADLIYPGPNGTPVTINLATGTIATSALVSGTNGQSGTVATIATIINSTNPALATLLQAAVTDGGLQAAIVQAASGTATVINNTNTGSVPVSP